MISLSVVMPAIIILSILLLVFAAIIMLLAVALVQRRKRRHSQPTAIPKIFEKRAIVSNVNVTQNDAPNPQTWSFYAPQPTVATTQEILTPSVVAPW